MTMTDMIMTATTAAMPTATMGHGDHGGHGGHGGGDCKITVSWHLHDLLHTLTNPI